MSPTPDHPAWCKLAYRPCRPVKKRRGAPLVQHVPLNPPNPMTPDQSNAQPQPEPHRVSRDGVALPAMA